jgi:hypothetical protein
VRGDVCWYWWNCWPSFNELKWDVILVDIGGIVNPISTKITSRLNSLSDGQQFHPYQQKSPLTSTHWVIGDVCWYWWNCWPSFNELKWDVILVDIGGIVNHPSMILGASTHWVMVNNSTNINKITSHLNSTITQWVEVRGDFCWYWWNWWSLMFKLSFLCSVS